MKSYSLIIPNVGQLAYETRFCYPLMRKYQQLNLQVDFDFAPVFFASTPQFKRCFVVKTSTAEDKTLLRNVRSIAFSIKCFPAGFVVFNSYMNLNEWNTQPLNHKLLNKILCGKKSTLLLKYINYLKRKFLEAIFKKEKIPEIKRPLIGPKIRINFIGENYNEEQFQKHSKLSFSISELKKVAIYKNNIGEFFYFNKKGVSFFTTTKMEKQRRKFLRHNLDLVMDIVYGIESLLPVLPKFITQTDQVKDLDVSRMVFTFAYSLNPQVLRAVIESVSMLPTASIRKWFSLSAEKIRLEEKYSHYKNLIIERIDELRVDFWYKIVANLLLENVPGFTSIYLKKINEQSKSSREIINLKIQLDTRDDQILNWFIEKLSRDLKERYTPPANDLLDETELGFITLFQAEKHFGIHGREHFDFKMKIDTLNAAGFLESKPYKGPGSKKGSKKYRANPKHQYVIAKLKISLRNSLISEIKIHSL